MKWIAASMLLLSASVALSANTSPDGKQAAGGTAEGQAASAPDVSACQGCHGVDGIATLPGAPNLAGQNAGYLEAQLRAFRAKERKNDLMNAIAGQLDDVQIKALAAYWSQRPAGGTMDDASRRSGVIRSLVSFPADFPRGFTIYHSQPDLESATITRDWANGPALDAARNGKPLPESGVIVVETVSAHLVDGKLVPDAATGYAILAAGPDWGAKVPKLLRNGNWHYGAFTANKSPRLTNQAACLACHKPQEASSFMFTMDALKEKARH